MNINEAILPDLMMSLLAELKLHVAYLIDTSGRFLERKIWNPLVYAAERLKKLRGFGQSYLINVKSVLM